MEKNQFSILIVDDVPQNIQVLGNILREENYTIGFATDGKKALDILKKTNGYDLVLLDINMPVMDGFDTCKAIRDNAKLKEIPIIFITAFTELDKVVKGFELGAQDYVTKPFKAKELLARVSTHIQLKHKTDQLNNMNKLLEEKVAERTKELEDANVKLEKLDRVKSDFLSLISHEIRTPLNGIVGFSEILHSELEDQGYKEFTQMLMHSAERLKTFSETALLVTNLKLQKYNLSKKEHNLQQLVDEIVEELKEQIHQKNLVVSTKISADNLNISIDEALIKRSVKNILENAVQLSPEGKKISIFLESHEAYLVIKVRDEGPGFSEKSLSEVFDLFNTSDIMHHAEGLGLSLATVKLIMDVHGGRAEAKNHENGAEVLIYLPIEQEFS